MSPCQPHGLKNKDRRGRGRISMPHDGKHFTCLAHRLAWALHNGEDPGSRVVRHTCDNAECVNPEHLVIGTQLDNVKDRVDRGRCARGTLNGRHRSNR